MAGHDALARIAETMSEVLADSYLVERQPHELVRLAESVEAITGERADWILGDVLLCLDSTRRFANALAWGTQTGKGDEYATNLLIRCDWNRWDCDEVRT